MSLEGSRTGSLPGRLARASHFAYRALWLLAGVLLLPGLFVGPVFDDWHHAYDTHAPVSWSQRLFGLYDFVQAGEVKLGRELGMLPWWADDGLSIAFFRPLSSLLVAVDHLWLDGGGVWSHVHSALWYALAVLCAGRVLRLLLGAADARWATLLYALSSMHVLPLAFTAALHSLVTAVFALLSFEGSIRGLATGQRRFHLASLLAYVLALCAGETAIGILPLAIAYAAAEHGLRRTLGALGPHLLATLAFAAPYVAFDYGAHHSSAYLQPGSPEFFLAAPRRWLVLVAGLFAWFPPDLWMIGLEPLQLAAGTLALLLAALALRSVTKRSEPQKARRLVALCAGALVSLVPFVAGIPGGRLLVLASLASTALFGIAARQAARAWAAGEKPRALALGTWVAALGIGFHPLLRAFIPADFARIGRELPEVASGVAERCPGAVVLATGVPDANMAYVPALLLQVPANERPSAFHLITMAPGEHRLRQISERRYELEIDGEFLQLPWARIYRDTPIPSSVARALQGVDLEVLEASGAHTRLGLTLRPEADACWLTLRAGELVPFEPVMGEPLAWTPSLRPM